MNLNNLISDYYQKEKAMKWEGTFGEYLDIVKENPIVAQNAHSRIYNMIVSKGVSKNENGNKVYHFFDELYGIEETISKLVDSYFKPAALGLDTKKRMLLMMGPVSSGKSTIASLLKKGLESYTKTEEGALYAIAGCPMNQEPLLLIPTKLRKQYEEELGVKIEGELNPYTKLLVQEKLKHELDGDLLKVPVKRIFFSEQERVGIGTFSPSDPKSQDISELVGSIDFSMISEYGSESDPRAYRFDGELNISNRGVVEFQEVLKCDQKFLWHLLSLTQEGNFKAGRFALISGDEVVLAHTNETEYRKFVSDPKNEALRSRMLVVHTPYNLKVSEEVKTYEKAIKGKLDMSTLSPFALEAVAEFSILTRLKQNDKVELVKKMELYNKDFDGEYSESDITEMKNEFQEEGLEGIDPRFIINQISFVLANNESKNVDAHDLLAAIKEGLNEHPSILAKEKHKYHNFISIVSKRYSDKIKAEVTSYLYETQVGSAQQVFSKYVEHAENYCAKSDEVDEDFLRSIEERIGISQNAKKAFREEITIRGNAYKRKGRTFEINSHHVLKEAINKFLFSNIRHEFQFDDEKLENIVAHYAKNKTCNVESAKKIFTEVVGMINKTA